MTRMRRQLLWTISLVLFFSGVIPQARATSYTFTTINVPGATQTFAYGINNSGNNDTGQIVGSYTEFASNPRAFLDSGGTFTNIVPNIGLIRPSAFTAAYRINDSGQIVGYFYDVTFHGYLDSGGSFTAIDFPGHPNTTAAYGINDSGQIVGAYGSGPPGSDEHGFLDVGASFTSIDFPGATVTQAYGINNSGQIVGFFVGPGIGGGFVDSGGVFTSFNVPGAFETQAYGINNRGQIVGFFHDATGDHGFLATPVTTPEPGALLLLATGLFGVVAQRRNTSRRSGGTSRFLRS